MLAVWVKDLSGSDGAAALVFGAPGLPALLAPFLGQLADRTSRRHLLVVANVSIVPVIAALLLVGEKGGLWLVYAVTFGYGAMNYLAASAQAGLIRDLLPDADLARGNGFLTTIDQGLRLLAPLVGTGLYVPAGPRSVVVLTPVCFTVAALLLSRVVVTESTPAAKPESGQYWHELSAGARHIARTFPMGVLTVALIIGMSATGLTNVAIFPVMEQGLKIPAASLGLLVSIQGIGALVGGITAARVIARLGEERVVELGLALMAVGMVPLLGSSYPAVVGGLLLVGLAIPWALVAFTTLRQRLTPGSLQGRVSAAVNLGINLPQTVLTLLGAWLVVALDYRLLIGGTIVLVLAAVLGTTLRVRRVLRRDDDAARGLHDPRTGFCREVEHAGLERGGPSPNPSRVSTSSSALVVPDVLAALNDPAECGSAAVARHRGLPGSFWGTCQPGGRDRAWGRPSGTVCIPNPTLSAADT